MEEKKSKLGLGILIGILVTLVICMGTFIIYDKFLSNNDKELIEKENDNLEKDDISNNKNNSSIENEEGSQGFDISKFDTTKEAINGPKGRMYTLYTENETGSGLSIDLNSNKKSATITIDWSKYGSIYGTSMWMNVENKYIVSNFTKNIKEVYIRGFGQAPGHETAIYVMEDGTVEYTPIKHALGNNGSSEDTILKSYGKMENVSDVVTILTGIDYCDHCIGEGLNLLGIKQDGTFYNLSSILYNTNYYSF